ncbi:MAG: GNAT family N-acetyltransferase [Ruminococcaceae bacterium]|nr:GNAT family N-acetyltransferase [Oscillospiraceae bacterium]
MMNEKTVCDFVIKRAEKQDEYSVKMLWQKIFGDEEKFIDGFYDAFPMKDNTFVAKVGGKVVGMVNAVDCKLLCEGEQLCGKYIYALAVEEAFRGRGIARNLLEASECEAESFVLLVPETPDLFVMYEKFGYNEKVDVDERFVDPALFFTEKKSGKKVSALVKIKYNRSKGVEGKKSDFFI